MTTNEEKEINHDPMQLITSEVFDNVFKKLCQDSLATAQSKGFAPGSVAESVALFHSEASEVLEDHRAGHGPNEVWYETTTKVLADGIGPEGDHEIVRTTTLRYKRPAPGLKPCGMPSELADIVIRIAHFCAHHEIDIGKAIREKAEYNKTRAFKHGKKY